jgi:putative transcriptional regulator
MSDPIAAPNNLTGWILVATPALLDPHFRRTILWLRLHSKEGGASGWILNRPVGTTIGELSGQGVPSSWQATEVHYGGPVGVGEPLLMGLRWNLEANGPEYRAFPAGFLEVPDMWQDNLRLLIGHSAWSPGQLEKEIEEKSWFVMPPQPIFFQRGQTPETWRQLLSSINPLLRLLAAAPDQPIWN